MEQSNKMKRILLSILAIFFPWMVILIEGKFIAAMACLALQLTVIGWIPASMWAFKTAKNIQLPENNDINTTQSAAETQVKNTEEVPKTTEIVANTPPKELDSNPEDTKDKE